ncbi:putative efflux protein, MATE family [Lachnospiraceae bacterium C7]|nr:putative efflux protein, MATE family [Lachnospiraceae bacterium C7]
MAKTRAMTEGAILPQILRFSIPLLLGNLVQQTYNFIDAMIVGKILGPDALGAVGASSSVQFLVLGMCIGLCLGFAVPVAQRFGACDYDKMRGYIYNSYILTVIGMVVITTICAILCPTILRILQTPSDIFDDAYKYLLIIFLGIPCTLLYNLLSSILRAVGDSTTPFIFLLISAILNIGLDLLLIVVFGMGVSGAALATITSQGISGVLCAFYITKKFPILKVHRGVEKFEKKYVKTLLVMGIPMGLQFSITAIGSMVMQSANNGLGTIYTSAFSAGMRIKQMTMCPFDAIASAISTFVGQNYGAGKAARIKKGIRKGAAVAAGYGVVIGVIMILFGRQMSMAFISSNAKNATEILDASGKYLACLGIFYWTLGILNTCRLAVQGLGYSNLAILSGVIEMISRTFVSVVFVPIFAFNAICFADQTAWITATTYSCLICIYVVSKVTKQLDKKAKA